MEGWKEGHASQQPIGAWVTTGRIGRASPKRGLRTYANMPTAHFFYHFFYPLEPQVHPHQGCCEEYRIATKPL